MSAPINFSHPLMPSNGLDIQVNPDQVVWSYGLNTKSFPTFGGEVVQILSVYFGDMTISGTVSTVAEMEQIYGWFITYMQYATQGRDDPSFDQHPVTFNYYERGWQFEIWPKSLPGFTYDLNVVAPTWTLVAAVKEPDATFSQEITDYAVYQASTQGTLDPFGKATANFGTTGDLENNPFGSNSAPSILNKKQTLADLEKKQIQALTDEYAGFVTSWSSANLTQLPQFKDISKPPGLPASASASSKTKTKTDAKKNTKAKKVKGP